MSNGIQWDGDQPVYDTINLAAAAVGGTFFTVPQGGAIGAAVKDNRHTNLTIAGMLETGTVFDCDSISMHCRQSVQAGALPLDADVRAVFSGNIRFMKGTTEWLLVPAQLIPAGGADLSLFSNIVAAATEYMVTHGTSAHQNRYLLKKNIPIVGGETFSVILEHCDAITAATHVTFVLWGMFVRPVR